MILLIISKLVFSTFFILRFIRGYLPIGHFRKSRFRNRWIKFMLNALSFHMQIYCVYNFQEFDSLHCYTKQHLNCNVCVCVKNSKYSSKMVRNYVCAVSLRTLDCYSNISSNKLALPKPCKN